jgi:hypothetical protein
MTPSEEINHEAIILSRAELIYLMDMLDAQHMIGLDMIGEESPRSNNGDHEGVVQKGRSSLMQRGLVRPGKNGGSDRAEGKLLKCAITSFFPQSSLVVVRNIPELGDQVLIFFRRDDYLLLHTFPEESTHRMESFDHPNQVLEMLLEWFPLRRYPEGESCLRLSLDRFEYLQGLAERGEEDAVVGLLQDQPLGDDEKLDLVRAIENRIISGSFAVLYIKGAEIRDAYSTAVLADANTAWLLEQPRDDQEGQRISLKRVGPDFVNVISDLIEKWLKSAPE